MASSANALGACTPVEGEEWIKSSTAVALLSAVSGAGATLPVTPCDSEWGAAVATEVKAAGAEVQCPVAPPNAQTSSDPSNPSAQKAIAPPASGDGGAGGDGSFPWWPIVAAVGGVSVTALAIFFIVAAYRRRDRRRVVSIAGSAAAGEPAWQLPSERAAVTRAAEVDSRATLAHAMREERLGCPTAVGGSVSVEANATGPTRAKLTWVALSQPQQQSVTAPMPPDSPSRARLFKRASGAQLGSEHLVTDATLDEGIMEITIASATGRR